MINYERKKEIMEQHIKGATELEKDLKKEWRAKAEYMNRNKEIKNLGDEKSAIVKKYNREISDYDKRISFHKNRIKSKIEDIISYAEAINSEVEPYIVATDTVANVRIGLYNDQVLKLKEEIKNLEKQRDMYPEYNREYTENGKKEYDQIEKNIEDKSKLVDELNLKIDMYSKRNELNELYKQNLVVINKYKENSKELGIEINENQSNNKQNNQGNNEQNNKSNNEQNNKSNNKQNNQGNNEQNNKNNNKQNNQNNQNNQAQTKLNIVIKDGCLDKPYLEANGYKYTLSELLENKKELYKRVGIKEIIKAKTGTKGIKAKLKYMIGRRNIDPAIVKAISMKGEDYKEMLGKYIESVVEKKELPFDLKIDLTSGIEGKQFEEYNRLAKFARKLPGVNPNNIKGIKEGNRFISKAKTLFNKTKTFLLGSGDEENEEQEYEENNDNKLNNRQNFVNKCAEGVNKEQQSAKGVNKEQQSAKGVNKEQQSSEGVEQEL